MFSALGLPWGPQSFVEGGFIQPKHPRYASLLAKLMEEMPRGEPYQLRRFFEILFDYRTRVHGVLSFPSGVLMASGFYLHAIRKAAELNRAIEDHLGIVDDLLVAFINPEGDSFPVEQLVQDYAYPDVNLLEIDADWA